MKSLIADLERKGFSSEIHSKLYDYWLLKKADRLMPSRADIRPEEIIGLLPHLLMVEVHPAEAGYQYKIRLTGTQVDLTMGRLLTGKWIHDFPEANQYTCRFDWLVENKRPYYIEDTLLFVSKDYTTYSALVCPLSDNGRDVNMMLVTNHYF